MAKKSSSKIIMILLIIILIAVAAAAGIFIFSDSEPGESENEMPEISLDDADYEISDGTVIIPEGRPRVPQIICDEADEIYQAFFADGEVHIVNVNKNGVVITADDGHNIEELVITRTIKTPVSVYMLTGQSNASYYYADEQEPQ